MAKLAVTVGGRRFKSKKELHAYKRAYFASATRGALVPPEVVREWLGPLIRAHPQPDRKYQIDLRKWAGQVRVEDWDPSAGPYLVNVDGTESQVSLNECIQRLKPTNMQLAAGHFLFGGGFREAARVFLLCATRLQRLPPEITRKILARVALAEVAFLGDEESALKVLLGDGTGRLPWERP